MTCEEIEELNKTMKNNQKFYKPQKNKYYKQNNQQHSNHIWFDDDMWREWQYIRSMPYEIHLTDLVKKTIHAVYILFKTEAINADELMSNGPFKVHRDDPELNVSVTTNKPVLYSVRKYTNDKTV